MAGKAAALPKFLDPLTLSQPKEADYAHQLALSCLKGSVITPLISKSIGIYYLFLL